MRFLFNSDRLNPVFVREIRTGLLEPPFLIGVVIVGGVMFGCLSLKYGNLIIQKTIFEPLIVPSESRAMLIGLFLVPLFSIPYAALVYYRQREQSLRDPITTQTLSSIHILNGMAYTAITYYLICFFSYLLPVLANHGYTWNPPLYRINCSLIFFSYAGLLIFLTLFLCSVTNHVLLSYFLSIVIGYMAMNQGREIKLGFSFEIVYSPLLLFCNYGSCRINDYLPGDWWERQRNGFMLLCALSSAVLHYLTYLCLQARFRTSSSEG